MTAANEYHGGGAGGARMAGRGGLLRWRAACPYCGSRFARREYLHSGRRRCGGCDAWLKPAEPANMLGNLAFGVPLGLALFGVMLYVQTVGAPTLEDKLKVAGVVIIILGVQFAIAAWVWPFITPFETLLWKCWNCQIELMHRYAICPRCGAPPKPVPRMRQARVIACGSDESPARSGSA
jgi:DNA-directed RNA polymerase subunit RPC12/RpoP